MAGSTSASGDEDELGSFIFRTSGFNSIRTLTTRLRYFQALAGDALSMLPLELRLRGKSTTLSQRTPIYYVDLTLRSGMSIANALMQACAASREPGFGLRSVCVGPGPPGMGLPKALSEGR